MVLCSQNLSVIGIADVLNATNKSLLSMEKHKKSIPDLAMGQALHVVRLQ